MATANPRPPLPEDNAGPVTEGASHGHEGGHQGGRLDLAFARLDAALSRLERAAVLRPQAEGEREKLQQENALLRATVGEALGELDKVLAELDTHG